MNISPELDHDLESSERRRRQLLAESDQVLEAVEELNLADRREVPRALQLAVVELQRRLGRPDPGHLATVQAAHHLVFAVQQRLMAANPKNPHPRPHLGRQGGQPQFAATPGGAWKFLTLPPRPTGTTEEQWLDMLQDTVDRACDRWAYAQHQALRAARERRPVEPALALARAAWANYWELRCEAERLGVRRPGRRRAELAARRR
jgi:hypothetical protein